MMMIARLPPPFELDETYIDRDGLYTVVAIGGDTLTIERPNGERSSAPAALKARIHRNIVADRDRPARRGQPEPGAGIRRRAVSLLLRCYRSWPRRSQRWSVRPRVSSITGPS